MSMAAVRRAPKRKVGKLGRHASGPSARSLPGGFSTGQRVEAQWPPDSVVLHHKARWYGAQVTQVNVGHGVYALLYDDGGVYNAANNCADCRHGVPPTMVRAVPATQLEAAAPRPPARKPRRAPPANPPREGPVQAPRAPKPLPEDTKLTPATAMPRKSEYELERDEKIKQNNEMLRQLGILHAAAVLTPVRTPSKPRPRTPRRPSCSKPSRRSKRTTSEPTRLQSPSHPDDFAPMRRLAERDHAACEAALSAAEQTAGRAECSGASFIKTMTPSMVEYSYKFGIGARGAEVLPRYGSRPCGSRKMIVWMIPGEGFRRAAQGIEWPCVYHDHSKNFDGGWMGFAKAHRLRTNDAVVFERLPDKFAPQRGGGAGYDDADLQRGWVSLKVTLHSAA